MRLITYDGIRDERIRKVTQYSLLLSEQPPLSNIEVLMAFSTAGMTRLRSNIGRDEDVTTLCMKAIKKISERRIRDMQVSIGDCTGRVL